MTKKQFLLSDFKGVKKILVIKLKHIGDVLLSVPVFRALKESFNGAYMSALVNSGTDEVLRGNPLIDEIIVFDRHIKKMGLLQRNYQELLFLREIRLRKFDMVVDLTASDRSAALSFISGARYRLANLSYIKGLAGKRFIYTHLSESRHDCHTVLKNLEVIKKFGIVTDNLSVDFYVEEKSNESVKKVFRGNGVAENDAIVHVHPVSRLFFKCWDDKYMAEVISWIINQNIKVVLTSSPDIPELEKARKILSLVDLRHCPQGILNLCGKTTIQELAAISRASFLFLGVDSAPMHIAAAVGTPVIALFGSGETRWRPWGDNHVVISKRAGIRDWKSKKRFTRENLLQIHPEDVIIELKKFIAARAEN